MMFTVNAIFLKCNNFKNDDECNTYELHREKTGLLPVRKQRRRSASQLLRS